MTHYRRSVPCLPLQMNILEQVNTAKFEKKLDIQQQHSNNHNKLYWTKP